RFRKAGRSSVPSWISATSAVAVGRPSRSRASQRESMNSVRELKIATGVRVINWDMSTYLSRCVSGAVSETEPWQRALPGRGPTIRGLEGGRPAPGLHGIGELDLEDLADLGLEGGVQHRERDLDAAIEVAGHPVRGGEQVFRVLTVLEVEDPRVLEVAVDDGDDADPRREPGHRGAQATRAAHDQVDPYARLAGVVQLLDQATVDQPVHLRDDPRGPPGPSMVRLTAD